MISWACLASFLTWLNDEQRFVAQQEVFLNQAVFSFDLSVMTSTWNRRPRLQRVHQPQEAGPVRELST